MKLSVKNFFNKRKKEIDPDWLYSSTVKDHFFNPQNCLVDDSTFDADGYGVVGSATCGDMMAVLIKVNEGTKTISECKWKTFGCPSAVASTSMMSIMVTENGGMSLTKARHITPESIIARLTSLPDRKYHCSVLGHLALREAIKDYEKQLAKKLEKRLYKIINKRKELGNVTTVDFVLNNDTNLPNFTPGQYVNIYSKDENITEGQSYSLSNSVNAKAFSITVKEMAEFSNFLASLSVGDVIEGSDPYGYFYSESTDSDLVFIVAGISITPIMSMIRSFSKTHPERKMKLFYTNSFIQSILFKEELDNLSKNNPNLTITYFITKEDKILEGYNNNRIVPANIVMDLNKYPSEGLYHEYFICGSINFVRDMWEGLKKEGINEEQIYTEAFFSH